ncbi:nuclear transport factor 2 family protein [Microlunatus speluncae]|uniref:nuclear transport factor 2 family protein n=1 Tax=Microlunatus speluncae TaxID=2594267 RepID=UPI001375F7BA|nr:nuclear transport factor 2 family protein [Microlunatus speluncae]
MADSTAPIDVAVRFIEAFGRRDLTALADCLADDIVFESPRMQLTGRDQVLAAIGEFTGVVDSVKITGSYGDARSAVVVYEIRTGPFGTIRAADHVSVRDGKITTDTLIFDTAALKA